MRKRTMAVILSVLMLVPLAGCGKKTVSSTGENIVKNESANAPREYDVKLDEREGDMQYAYGEDDLSLIDTNTGKKITLGMSRGEIEAVTGEVLQKEMNDSIYDGVVVRYEDDTAVSLIVSAGRFRDGQETRYKTSRGVGIGTTGDDFKKAYGDSYNEGEETTAADTGEKSKAASRAVRYFEKDGKKVEFLGTELSTEQKSKDKSNYYLQDFMFSNADGTIATIRVSLLSAVAG